MLQINEILEADETRSVDDMDALCLWLPHELRTRSRLRCTMSNGEEAALVLPRGRVLRDGQQLRAADGRVVVVRASAERVSSVRSTDPLVLTRAAYHLGNRHVALQVGVGELRYLHDHVLDDMLRGLGLQVQVKEACFEPEDGAYGHSHSSAAGHSHGEDHGHAHPHPHDHGHGQQGDRRSGDGVTDLEAHGY